MANRRCSRSPASLSAAVVRSMSWAPARRMTRFLQVLALKQEEGCEQQHDADRRERRGQRREHQHQALRRARRAADELRPAAARFSFVRVVRRDGKTRPIELLVQVVEQVGGILEHAGRAEPIAQVLHLLAQCRLVARQFGGELVDLVRDHGAEAQDDRHGDEHGGDDRDRARHAPALQKGDDRRQHEGEQHREHDRESGCRAQNRARRQSSRP